MRWRCTTPRTSNGSINIWVEMRRRGRPSNSCEMLFLNLRRANVSSSRRVCLASDSWFFLSKIDRFPIPLKLLLLTVRTTGLVWTQCLANITLHGAILWRTLACLLAFAHATCARLILRHPRLPLAPAALASAEVEARANSRSHKSLLWTASLWISLQAKSFACLDQTARASPQVSEFSRPEFGPPADKPGLATTRSGKSRWPSSA